MHSFIIIKLDVYLEEMHFQGWLIWGRLSLFTGLSVNIDNNPAVAVVSHLQFLLALPLSLKQ